MARFEIAGHDNRNLREREAGRRGEREGRTSPLSQWNSLDRTTSIPEVILRGERQLYGRVESTCGEREREERERQSHEEEEEEEEDKS